MTNYHLKVGKMRCKYSPNHLKSPLLHSYFTQSIFPVIILNRNIKFSPQLHQQTVSLIRIKRTGSSVRQTGHQRTPFPSIGLALLMFGPPVFGAGRIRDPRGPRCCAGRRGRASGAQWSPLQFYYSVRRGLLVGEQNLSRKWVCGSVFSAPGTPGSQGMPGYPSAQGGWGFWPSRALSCHSTWRLVCHCRGPGLEGTSWRHPDWSRVLDFNLGASGRAQKSDGLRTSLTVHTFFLFSERYQSPLSNWGHVTQASK